MSCPLCDENGMRVVAVIASPLETGYVIAMRCSHPPIERSRERPRATLGVIEPLPDPPPPNAA
ncbi:hypothetical protein HNR56_003137 [Roseospira marina]|nr:hypothetical protein [Roseospira marina]MBB5088429.1 hypothetical protein [Roseospira marina]